MPMAHADQLRRLNSRRSGSPYGAVRNIARALESPAGFACPRGLGHHDDPHSIRTIRFGLSDCNGLESSFAQVSTQV